ncbi:MAG: hypothetical protein GW938_10215 [Leptospira sp.]|nr:hypothetical protein [Leptospira sp.]NCS93503.1 hypothetical protein [Leptospira sp.]
MAIGNPHDLFIRRIFSNKEESIEFFKATFPENLAKLLDLSNLVHCKESFIADEHKETRTDLPFKLNSISLRIYMNILQKIRVDHIPFLTNLRISLKELLQEKEDYKRVEILTILLNYIFSARDDSEKYYDITIFDEVESEYMNVLEKLRQEGIEKGKLEGKLEKAIEDAPLMKIKGYPISDILEITGLTKA